MKPTSHTVNATDGDDPWSHMCLPVDHLHAASFLRPDTILHVFDLWRSDKHAWEVTRSFGPPDCESIRPFFSMGLRACIEFIDGWCLDESSIYIFRGFESLTALPEEFWTYIAGLKNTINARGLPDGELMGAIPMTISDGVRKLYGDRPVPLTVFEISGPAPLVSLMSEGIAAILDFSIAHSTRVTAQVLHDDRVFLGRSERELHGFWAMQSALIERILSKNDRLIEDPTALWLWCDPLRDPDSVARAQIAAAGLEEAGRKVTIVIRAEEH